MHACVNLVFGLRQAEPRGQAVKGLCRIVAESGVYGTEFVAFHGTLEFTTLKAYSERNLYGPSKAKFEKCKSVFGGAASMGGCSARPSTSLLPVCRVVKHFGRVNGEWEDIAVSGLLLRASCTADTGVVASLLRPNRLGVCALSPLRCWAPCRLR